MKTKTLRRLLGTYSTTSLEYCLIGTSIGFALEHVLQNVLSDIASCAISLTLSAALVTVAHIKTNKHLVREYNQKLARDAYELAEQISGNPNIDHDVLKELLSEIRESKME